jgi:hypothetical protein
VILSPIPASREGRHAAGDVCWPLTAAVPARAAQSVHHLLKGPPGAGELDVGTEWLAAYSVTATLPWWSRRAFAAAYRYFVVLDILLVFGFASALIIFWRRRMTGWECLSRSSW